MKTITTTADLEQFCEMAAQHSYVTVDTEFLRERTYYSKLCLVQLAVPGNTDDTAVLVDPLSSEISLAPLYKLFQDTNVVKVFHAARQDLEIFWHDAAIFPEPLFDTQVAAMVCGFGEQVGYETLVKKIAKQPLDKSSRFTDWSRRPLSDAQKNYAIGDVTHLRQVYEFLSAEIARVGRVSWVAEEQKSSLTNPALYDIEPDQAWKRVKTRTSSGKFLAYVRELAAFRESHAQTRNIPRNRVFKDDVMVELASTKPASIEDLGRSRLLQREARKGDIAQGILNAIQNASKLGPDEYPKVKGAKDKLQVNPALADLLRVLLKAKSDESDVAQKMIATVSDLDALAAGQRDVAALSGWRLTVFGQDALRLCDGQVGLAVKGNKVKLFDL